MSGKGPVESIKKGLDDAITPAEVKNTGCRAFELRQAGGEENSAPQKGTLTQKTIDDYEAHPLFPEVAAHWSALRQMLAEDHYQSCISAIEEKAENQGLKRESALETAAFGRQPGTYRIPTRHEVQRLDIYYDQSELDKWRPEFEKLLGEPIDDHQLRLHLVRLKPSHKEKHFVEGHLHRFIHDVAEHLTKVLLTNSQTLGSQISQLKKLADEPGQPVAVQKSFRTALRQLEYALEYCKVYIGFLRDLREGFDPYVNTKDSGRHVRQPQSTQRIPPLLQKHVDYALTLFSPPRSKSLREAERKALTILAALYPGAIGDHHKNAFHQRMMKLTPNTRSPK